MRVTQSIMSRNLIQNLNLSRENMGELQKYAATGKEITNSSDDPVKFARASRYRKTLSQYDQYVRNINNGLGFVDNNAMVMNEFHNLVVEARSVAIQGADASQSASTRLVLADRINGIIEQTISIANSSYLGKSIFSGTDTLNMEPFEYDGNVVTYSGNNGKMSRHISEGLDVEINITGTELAAAGVFDSLIALREALEADDAATVAGYLTDLDSAANNLLGLESKNGLVKSHMLMSDSRIETARTNILSFLSETEDSNLAEVIMEYNGEEMAYEAALQVTSKALQLNIMDFIR
ncbi:MAG: flagellar hook-associated protein FlgL [Candidatus Marinimicrobia bacterium]|nr:flagellar hook-associated protein FlgL [Candidatus Neomarinimicrobiota bacterium]